MKKSIQNSEHYNWGDNCDGWYLINTNNLSVIQESMPPNTRETIHYHNFSQQFFYILKGHATFILNEKTAELKEGEGLHIKPKTIHQIKNNSSKSLHFLVISQPASKDDRIGEPFINHP